MKRNLMTVAAFAASSPFSENQCRWWIFQSGTNGLGDAGALVRVGRRVYIDVDGFDRWLAVRFRVMLSNDGSGV
jgi:hypothetical protein